jgi:hypothetical protein
VDCPIYGIFNTWNTFLEVSDLRAGVKSYQPRCLLRIPSLYSLWLGISDHCVGDDLGCPVVERWRATDGI